jgi:hypothetical protein
MVMQVTNKLYHIMLSWVHPAWVGFELPTLVVIGTDCIGSCKSNYHTIMTMMTQCYRYMYTCTSSWSKESEYVLFQLQIYWTISLYCSRVMPLLYTSFYNTDDCVALVVEVLQIYSSSWEKNMKNDRYYKKKYVINYFQGT